MSKDKKTRLVLGDIIFADAERSDVSKLEDLDWGPETLHDLGIKFLALGHGDAQVC